MVTGGHQGGEKCKAPIAVWRRCDAIVFGPWSVEG